MSNDTPPRACLADYGFITTIFDPDGSMSHSAQSGGGATTFMSPELMAPVRFGKKDSKPTPRADIYAFGMVIFQVRKQNRRYQPFLQMLSPGPNG